VKRIGIAVLLVGATAFAAPSIATMKAALEKGDVDEASRQGVLAVVETALASKDRVLVLAGITAAPHVEDRAELLGPLAKIAQGPDRRTAIPAAHAAMQIAREMARQEPPDDIADADIVAWRDDFAEIALDRDRWIEVRVLAIDVAAYVERSRRVPAGTAAPGLSRTPLDPTKADGVGVPLAKALADPDPAVRRAVLAHVPSPVPPELREVLATAIEKDIDPLVALAAAAPLCADLAFDPPAPILAALGDAGIERIATIVTTDGASRGALKEAARCLAADKSPSSTAALRKLRNLR
jgi:hypothetical protein